VRVLLLALFIGLVAFLTSTALAEPVYSYDTHSMGWTEWLAMLVGVPLLMELRRGMN
jgi:hypothetical protein